MRPLENVGMFVPVPRNCYNSFSIKFNENQLKGRLAKTSAKNLMNYEIITTTNSSLEKQI